MSLIRRQCQRQDRGLQLRILHQHIRVPEAGDDDWRRHLWERNEMNYFNTKAAAERYSTGRPDFHRTTIKHIKDFLRLETKLDRALDIACGTGLSTKALLEIA